MSRSAQALVQAVEGYTVALGAIGDIPVTTIVGSGRWAFQAAIFTQDVDRALQAARELQSAAVMINDHSAFRVDWMPFGGQGPSGLGVGGIGPAMRDLVEEKLIVVKYREAPRSI